MTAAPLEQIDGAADILLLCDHAANAVPADIELGVGPQVLARHVAVDIGAGPLTRALAGALGAPALLATVSRLVIDLNRPVDHADLVPVLSDGHAIPGNVNADMQARVARFHAPYHNVLARQVRERRPRLIVGIHSFTPALETGPHAPRPWEVGILYNRQARAARMIIAALEQAGVVTGDNAPYSGRQLNMTLNRHAEGQGIGGFSIEVRNDLIANEAGVAKWAAIIAPILFDVRNRLAQNRSFTT